MATVRRKGICTSGLRFICFVGKYVTLFITISQLLQQVEATEIIEGNNLESFKVAGWDGTDNSKPFENPEDYRGVTELDDNDDGNGVWVEDGDAGNRVNYRFNGLSKYCDISSAKVTLKYYMIQASAYISPCKGGIGGGDYCYVDISTSKEWTETTFELKEFNEITIAVGPTSVGYIMFDNVRIEHDGTETDESKCGTTTVESTTSEGTTVWETTTEDGSTVTHDMEGTEGTWIPPSPSPSPTTTDIPTEPTFEPIDPTATTVDDGSEELEDPDYSTTTESMTEESTFSTTETPSTITSEGDTTMTEETTMSTEDPSTTSEEPPITTTEEPLTSTEETPATTVGDTESTPTPSMPTTVTPTSTTPSSTTPPSTTPSSTTPSSTTPSSTTIGVPPVTGTSTSTFPPPTPPSTSITAPPTFPSPPTPSTTRRPITSVPPVIPDEDDGLSTEEILLYIVIPVTVTVGMVAFIGTVFYFGFRGKTFAGLRFWKANSPGATEGGVNRTPRDANANNPSTSSPAQRTVTQTALPTQSMQPYGMPPPPPPTTMPPNPPYPGHVNPPAYPTNNFHQFPTQMASTNAPIYHTPDTRMIQGDPGVGRGGPMFTGNYPPPESGNLQLPRMRRKLD